MQCLLGAKAELALLELSAFLFKELTFDYEQLSAGFVKNSQGAMRAKGVDSLKTYSTTMW